MIVDPGELSAWCTHVPDLQQVGPNAWQQASISRVSYPGDGLEVLTDLEEQSYWFNHRNRVIASVVRQVPPPGLIFDIGGGNGYVSKGLAAAGFAAVVIEPDASGVATARGRGLPTIQAAFQSLALPSGSIPAAGMFDVLEHIEDDLGAMVRLHEVLEPGGVAYVAVPAHNMLWSSEDNFAGHFRRYTVGSLKNLMRRAGFEPIFGTYFFKVLAPAVFTFRTLPSLFRLRNTAQDTALREHMLPGNLIGRALTGALDREFHVLEAGGAIKLGSSVLVVAKKARN